MPESDQGGDGGRDDRGEPSGGARSTWATVGIVLGVLAAVAGLFVVALVIVVVVGLNSWASNK